MDELIKEAGCQTGLTALSIPPNLEYTRLMNKTQLHHNGQFITSGDPSSRMRTVMENIQRQMQAEHEYRMAVRAGRIEQVQSANWNISDRN